MKKSIEQKKKDVLQVATKLFAENGYEGTTMADIAKLAGVGFGTVSTYYGNKENLLLACIEEPMEQFINVALDFDDNPDNFEDELKKLTKLHFKLFHEERIYLLLIIHITSQYERYMKPYLVAHLAAKKLVEKLELFIQHGQQKGALLQGDPNVIANAYISVLLGLFLSNVNPFSEEALERFADNSIRLFGLQ